MVALSRTVFIPVTKRNQLDLRSWNKPESCPQPGWFRPRDSRSRFSPFPIRGGGRPGLGAAGDHARVPRSNHGFACKDVSLTVHASKDKRD